MGRVVLAAAALAIVSGSACAMNSTEAVPERCVVFGGEKLPAEANSGVICSAIEAAANAQAPGASYMVEVRVLSSSSLAATVRLDGGRVLPEQRMAVSDRQLNRGSIDRFAAAIASEIGKQIR